MDWIEPELIRVFCPAFADVIVGCETSQGFPSLLDRTAGPDRRRCPFHVQDSSRRRAESDGPRDAIEKALYTIAVAEIAAEAFKKSPGPSENNQHAS